MKTFKEFISDKEPNDLHSHLNKFAGYCCEYLELPEAPKLILHDDPNWTTNNGTFGYYSPSTNTINLSTTSRHPMDIMRTLAHELTHAAQHSDDPLPQESGETGSEWENDANAMAGILMRNWRSIEPNAFNKINESVSLQECVDYHINNDISFVKNIFRPGSDKFFAMIKEAKKLYSEGMYQPEDEYERDLLESNIGEKAIYEGQEVILDFPFQETLNEEYSDPYAEREFDHLKGKSHEELVARRKHLQDRIRENPKAEAFNAPRKREIEHIDKLTKNINEDDETGGHGIGKPFRSHGGGSVYVKNEKGNVVKVNFSQSGMKKRINEPGRVRSFVARHHCLTNKDKTSAGYWACRWPRYFSDTGQQWW